MTILNYAFRDAFQPVNDIKLRYRVWQTEPSSAAFKRDLLLVHGLGSTLDIWDCVVPHLIDRFAGKVSALDQRGHGHSDKPDDGYTTSQIVQDDHALAQALGLKQPVIVGHSWGATIAMAYAIAHPDAVRAIILVDGVFGDLKDEFGPTWEEAKAQFNMRDSTGTPKAEFLQRYLGDHQGRYFAPVWNEDLERTVLKLVRLRDDGTIAPYLSYANDVKLMRSLWETSHIELARQVTCPVLMVAAVQSPLPGDTETQRWLDFKHAGMARMLSAFGDQTRVEQIVMTDTVHDIPLQRPQELSRIILDFVEKTETADLE